MLNKMRRELCLAIGLVNRDYTFLILDSTDFPQPTTQPTTSLGNATDLQLTDGHLTHLNLGFGVTDLPGRSPFALW